MNKFYLIACLLIIPGLSTPKVNAQLNNEGMLFTVDMGSVIIKNVLTHNTINGASLTASFEKLTMDGTATAGFSFGFIRTSDEIETTDGIVKYVISSYPAMLRWRYIFGSERFKGYMGVGIGMHISRIDQTNDITKRHTRPAGTVPLGVHWIVSDGLYLDAGYTFNYFSNSFYSNDLVHIFNIGIGIQFGK